jgi:hypothetical protein
MMNAHEELIKRLSGPEWHWDGDVTWAWEPNGPHEKPYAMLTIVVLGDSEPFYSLTIWHARNQVYNAYSYDATLILAIIDIAGPGAVNRLASSQQPHG